MEINQFLIPCLTLLCGWVLIYLINFLGTGFSTHLSFSQDESGRPLLSLFFGYLILACLGSFFVVGFHTIFTAVFTVLLCFLYFSGERKQVKPVWLNREWAFQIFLFTVFAVYRFLLVFNFKSSGFNFFFLDDYYYQDCIAAISAFGEERKFSELINKSFDLPYFYSQYHYFTFSLPALLRTITGINVYHLFNFFLVPFVQMLAFCGLYYLSIGITNRKIVSLLIALIGISSLRYNMVNELVSALPVEFFLRNSVVLKSHYGFQFLNSGFGLKFCISLFLISVFIKMLNVRQMVSFSAVLLYINPLFIFPFLVIQTLGQYYAKAKFSLLPTVIYLAPLVLFITIQTYRPGASVVNEVVKNLESVFAISLKSHFVSVFGYFFNEFYAVYLLPWVLILFVRKSRIEILLSFLLIVWPVLESLRAPKLLTLAYFASILLLGSILIARQIKNPIFTFLIINGVLLLLGMPFSQLMPNFNQVFILVVYPVSLLLTVYLVSVLIRNRNQWVFSAFFILVCLGNMSLNFEESVTRRIPIMVSNEFEKRIQEIVPDSDKPSVMGIFDSRVLFISYSNQYFIGEEIQFFDDRIFPVFVKFSTEKPDLSVFESNAKEIQPFLQFSKTLPSAMSDDMKAMNFCQKYNIPYLLVKQYDLDKVPNVKSLYSDSLFNEKGKYWIFYKGRHPAGPAGL